MSGGRDLAVTSSGLTCHGQVPVPVTVHDEYDPETMTFGPRVITRLCPECLGEVKTASEHLRDQLREQESRITAIAESFRMDGSGHFVVSKQDYESYRKLVAENNATKASLRSLPERLPNTGIYETGARVSDAS